MQQRRDEVELSSGVRIVSNDGAPPREPVPTEREGADAASPGNFLRVWFACSGQYARGQKTADGAHYQARCPKCAKCMRFRIGAGGTSERFFTVTCS